MRIGCCGQDPHKFARAQELLRMNEEIKQAKKVRCWLLTSCKVSPDTALTGDRLICRRLRPMTS